MAPCFIWRSGRNNPSASPMARVTRESVMVFAGFRDEFDLV
jgi:hypothetical protein